MDPYLHSPNTPSWRGAQLKKHMNNFTFYPKIQSNTTFLFTPRSSECSLSFRFSKQNFYAFLISSKCATCPVIPIA